MDGQRVVWMDGGEKEGGVIGLPSSKCADRDRWCP